MIIIIFYPLKIVSPVNKKGNLVEVGVTCLKKFRI